MDMFEMNPAAGVYSPPRQKRQPMDKATRAARAKARRDARESVQERRAARAVARRRAATRGPIDVFTMSPGTIEYIMQRQQKARDAALQRRLRDPNFAARHRQKMLGHRYRQGGRLLGQEYKAPLNKRKGPRMMRKQGGVGLKKLIKEGGQITPSLMEYAEQMRKKARAAYIRRKKRMGKGSFVRTPMTAAQKKAKRASAYRKKKQAMAALAQAVTSPIVVEAVGTNMSPVSPLSPVAPVAPILTISPPRTRSTTRISAPKPPPRRRSARLAAR